MINKYNLADVFSKNLRLSETHLEKLCNMFRVVDEYEKIRFKFALGHQHGKGKLSYRKLYEEICFNDLEGYIFFRMKSFSNTQMNLIIKNSIINGADFRSFNPH